MVKDAMSWWQHHGIHVVLSIIINIIIIIDHPRSRVVTFLVSCVCICVCLYQSINTSFISGMTERKPAMHKSNTHSNSSRVKCLIPLIKSETKIVSHCWSFTSILITTGNQLESVILIVSDIWRKPVLTYAASVSIDGLGEFGELEKVLNHVASLHTRGTGGRKWQFSDLGCPILHQPEPSKFQHKGAMHSWVIAIDLLWLSHFFRGVGVLPGIFIRFECIKTNSENIGQSALTRFVLEFKYVFLYFEAKATERYLGSKMEAKFHIFHFPLSDGEEWGTVWVNLWW